MHAGASEPRAEREGAIPADAPARRQSVRKSTWMRSLSHVNATQQTFPIWRNVNTQECSLARSPFTGAMSHGDAIPAMQMQTCMIFAQILLFTIISRLFPFLCHKTTMTKVGRKMPGASSLLVQDSEGDPPGPGRPRP